MTWALKRKITYLAILFLFFLGFGMIVAYPRLNKEPTCFDGKRNGDESGVDCGGSCQLVCSFEVEKVSVLWARSFKVVPGRYNAVAYLENQNVDSAVYKVKYKFRFADSNNIYIGKRDGEAYIPPRGKFAVFEPAIDTGNSIPVYTTFEFTEAPVWVNVSKEKIEELKLSVSDINLEGLDKSPHLGAKLTNESLFTIPGINVIAILYDSRGNAVSASRTYVDKLNGEEEVPLNFTWPEPFSANIITKEIIPIYNIFNVKLN